MEDIAIGIQQCAADDRLTFLQISQGLLEWTGYTRQEVESLFGNSLIKMADPKDAAELREEISRQLNNKQEFHVLFRIRRKHNQSMWIFCRGDYREDKKQVLLCELIDAVRCCEADDYYKNALQSMPNPIFITDSGLRILFMNRAAEQSTGRRFQDCRGNPCSMFGTPICGTENCCVKRYQNGQSAAVQKDPENRSYRVQFNELKDKNGRCIGYISTSTDITELMETQEKLKISEERYRLALQQTNNVIWEYDIQNKTLYHPDKHYGTISAAYQLDQVVANVPESLIKSGFVHPDFADPLREMYRRIRSGEPEVQCQLKVRTKKGVYRWGKISASTICDENGVPIRAVGISRDVTEEIEREKQYADEKRYRDSLTAQALCSYEVDLTKDSLVSMPTSWTENLTVDETTRYSELVRQIIEKMVHPKYRRRMQETLGREALLKAYEQGEQELHFEYQRLDEAGNMIWVRYSVYLIQSAWTGNVCAFIYLKDVDQEKKNELELRNKAERDPLTRLYNREAACSLIKQSLDNSQNVQGAVFMLDIDNFKKINDTYGHLYGDAVLSEMANSLTGVFRKEDILGRMGGDEFMVFLKGIPTQKTALDKAQQICDVLRTDYTLGEQKCAVSGSVGIAFFPQDGEDFETLYKKADTALYYAKNQGKNRYAVYEDSFEEIEYSMFQTPDTEKQWGKSFSDHITEYVFKILHQSDDLQTTIPSVLELLAKHFHAEHVYVVEFDAQHEVYSTTFEWYASNYRFYQDWTTCFTHEQIRNYQRNFDAEGFLCLEDLCQYQPEFQEAFQQMGLVWGLQCTMKFDGAYCGFVGLSGSHKAKPYTKEERESIQSVSEIIGTFLHGKRREQEKEKHVSLLTMVLDSMLTAAYVVNPNNYEIVFMNQKTQKIFSDARIGSVCHKSFRKMDQPCSDCPMLSLQNNRQKQAELRFHTEGGWVEVSAGWMDWVDGQQYCVLNCMGVHDGK
ncbi:diguanylate cyclase domain-containing protein [Candidatus Soleaferrea massiliensis]|uniref:diguanylate cyclase domain-containing protein n=1 Tax=Candidatus Soleaferrea massiliensis TaxID=1470354 RepID=UPI0005903D8A|nr:diguanylate cyclase [Candidatus Soleaferrea massiliensis]